METNVENKLIEFIGYTNEYKNGIPEKRIINIDNIQSICRYYYTHNNCFKDALKKAPNMACLYYYSKDLNTDNFHVKIETVIHYGEQDKQETFYGVEPYEVVCEKISNAKNGFSITNFELKDKYFFVDNNKRYFVNLKEIPKIIIRFKYDKNLDPNIFMEEIGEENKIVYLQNPREEKNLYCFVRPYNCDTDNHEISMGLEFCSLTEYNRENILLRDELENLLKGQEILVLFRKENNDSSFTNIWTKATSIEIAYME